MKPIAVLCNKIDDAFLWFEYHYPVKQWRMAYRICTAEDGKDYHFINSINQVLGMEFSSYIEVPGFMNPRLLEETKIRCR